MNGGRSGSSRRAHAVVCAGILFITFGMAFPRRASATPARVVLLQSAAAGPAARRCLRLIRDELAAGGFDVAVAEVAPTGDPYSLANAMHAQGETVATIGLLGDPEDPRAELWILDRLGGEAEVRRLPVPVEDRERRDEVLAIRTVEVLRASALKFLIGSARAEPAAAATTAAAVPPLATVGAAAAPVEASPRRRGVGIETGVSMLASPGELLPAAIPVARLRAAGGPIVARLTLAGLGSRPRLPTARGTAVVDQALGLVELGVAFRTARRLAPVLLVGAGVLHVGTDARGIDPYVGQRDRLWAAVVSAGAGVVLAVSSGLAVSLEAHVLLASPHPVIRFVDLEAAVLMRPALWTTLTLVSWL